MFRSRLYPCLGIASLGCFAHAALAADAPSTFAVREYRVLGNTVLAPVDIEHVLYPRLGENKSIADVEQARVALEEHYHEVGYGTVFVDIPEQQIEDGIVRLKVTEGRIARLRVTGAHYFSGRIIKGALPEAAEGKVPQLPELQAQLTALNTETSDRVATPVLKPGADPGTVQLTLNVKEQLPLHASLAVNNQYSADTSPLRAIATLNYDQMFGRLDSLSLGYQSSPQQRREVDVWIASYIASLPHGAGKLTASFIRSNSNVGVAGDAGANISVLGKGKIYGLHWQSAPSVSPQSLYQFNAGVDYKDYTESVFSDDLLLTPIGYFNFSVGQNSAWRFANQQFVLGTSANFGVRGFGNNTDEFEVKRYKGVPNYFLIRGDTSYTQRMPWDSSLRLRIGGQYAVDSIITNEQYSIAGSSGVRGYLESEQLGDVGVRGTLEFGSPTWNLVDGSSSIDGFAFYDHGWMKRNNPLPERDPVTHEIVGYLEARHATLRSVGLGLNVSMFSRHLEGSLAWAYPLKDSGIAGGTGSGDSRVLFSVRTHW